MLVPEIIEKLKKRKRSIRPVDGKKNESLGPLTDLVGEWNNKDLPGRGWNMIALPFKADPNSNFPINYRLLLNQYNETLRFNFVDDAIPNRGIEPSIGGGQVIETDQFLAAVDYEQFIKQIAAEDFPDSGLAGDPGLAIHHEPGLWLHMFNRTTLDLDIARLATIPHGDSVLALGTSDCYAGPPVIPDINGLPIGVNTNLDSPYMAPYKHFHEKPFRNLFDPTVPNALLREALKGLKVKKTTSLKVDTTVETGGIINIPFIVKQANAAEMQATFWILELENGDMLLQYSQLVMLDFFPRSGGCCPIRWPHISINTMTKAKNKSKPGEYPF